MYTGIGRSSPSNSARQWELGALKLVAMASPSQSFVSMMSLCSRSQQLFCSEMGPAACGDGAKRDFWDVNEGKLNCSSS